jgi:hypothetical protein
MPHQPEWQLQLQATLACASTQLIFLGWLLQRQLCSNAGYLLNDIQKLEYVSTHLQSSGACCGSRDLLVASFAYLSMRWTRNWLAFALMCLVMCVFWQFLSTKGLRTRVHKELHVFATTIEVKYASLCRLHERHPNTKYQMPYNTLNCA